jgi:hypothetical protein
MRLIMSSWSCPLAHVKCLHHLSNFHESSLQSFPSFFLSYSFDDILIYSKTWKPISPMWINFSVYYLWTNIFSNVLNVFLEPLKPFKLSTSFILSGKMVYM